MASNIADGSKTNFDPKSNISHRKEDTGQSLFVYIDEWGGDKLFMYILILIVVIWICSKQTITLNLVVSLSISYFVISYLNHMAKTTNNTLQDIVNIKESKIEPIPKKTTLKHTDVRNLLFSIQDMRVYNAQAYEEMMRHIDDFFEYYDIVFVEPSRSYVYYGLMEQAKRDALNALKSLIFICPEDARVRGKLNRSTDVMDKILTKYLDQISFIADEYTHKYGYTVDTKILSYGAKPYNQYDDIFQPYSYEVY
jgi:hypothetical protein